MVNLRIIEGVMLTEFILVALILLLTYILVFLYYRRQKREKRIREGVEHYLRVILVKKQPFNPRHIPPRWRHLQVLIPLLKELDKEVTSERWPQIKHEFVHSIILPLARVATTSVNWVQRYFAAESFALDAEKRDEAYIIALMHDKIPIVYIRAINVALLTNSTVAIETMLDRMGREPWLSQAMYLQAFDQAPVKSRPIFEDELKKSKDLNIRSACYKILLRYPPSAITWDIEKDLKAEQPELQVGALKYLTYADPDKAVPILIEGLKSPNLDMRLVSLHRLSTLGAKVAIPEIAKCLDDEDWWVKISAAEALKRMGEEGEQELEKHTPEFAQIPYEITHHVSNTLW